MSRRQLAVLRQANGAIERRPAHDLGMREVKLTVSHFPDARVRLAPIDADIVGDARENPPHVVVECALGAALLVNLKPRIALALTSLLLLLFLGVVGYAWATGATESCGCFGPWKRTPGEAFVEDLVLLALADWAWWGRWPTPAPTNTAKLAFVGFAVALNAPDRFGMLLALGITMWLVGQAFINIGVALGLLPVTGLPLPFLSFGGSSLVVTLAACGMLMSVARHTRV